MSDLAVVAVLLDEKENSSTKVWTENKNLGARYLKKKKNWRWICYPMSSTWGSRGEVFYVRSNVKISAQNTLPKNKKWNF